MQRSLAYAKTSTACNDGNIPAFLRIYRNVVVAGGDKLRYTPQVRGSQQSFGFLWVRGGPLQPADTVVQRR